ncbi:MAG: GNAT family N-acetyltransferase [Flavobacteriales bacterium]
MVITIQLLGTANRALLHNVAADVFDFSVDPHGTDEFIRDPRHHMMVAVDEGVVVGMASAVDDVHPDKAPQFWIIEVGVASTHRSRGIGKQLLDALLAHGRAIGCTEAWVGTGTSNTHARRLHASAGGVADTDFVLFEFPLGALRKPSPSTR